PGYWKRPDLTRAAFDEDGFYKPGDAVRFADPAEPAKGIVFDGRLAEDFKLATGTWVAVGVLRVAALAAASPALQDAIIAGENREWVGMLAWLNAAGCRKLVGCEAGLPELARHPAVREHVGRAIARWNADHGGSSQRIARVLLLPDAPSIDANEITDKGYINQRLALKRRKAEVERLFAPVPDPDGLIGSAPPWRQDASSRRGETLPVSPPRNNSITRALFDRMQEEACDGRPFLKVCGRCASGRHGGLSRAALCRPSAVFGFDAARGRAARQFGRDRAHVDCNLRARVSIRGASGGTRRGATSTAIRGREGPGAIGDGLRLGCGRPHRHQRSRGRGHQQSCRSPRLRPGVAGQNRRHRAQLRPRG